MEFCYSALSRPDQAICYSLLTGRSSRDENRMKGTFFESSTSARRSMLMVSGITLLFLPVCSRKRVSISIGVPVRQHPPARLTQGFAGLQKALKSYRRVYRVTEGFKKLQRALQGYRGLYIYWSTGHPWSETPCGYFTWRVTGELDTQDSQEGY